MSGLLERIARRRRASASSRLGPPAALTLPPGWSPAGVRNPADPTANGNDEIPADGHDEPTVNGHDERTVNGRGEGTVAGHGEGTVNGHAEGTVNGHAEGTVNGHPEGTANGRPTPRGDGGGTTNGGAAGFDAGLPPWMAIAAPPTAPRPDAPPLEPATPAEEAVGRQLARRGRIRRRILYLRALRELQLRDLGGFMLELRRFETARPELVEAKLDSAAAVDAELRALEQALEQDHLLGEIRAPGIGGACNACGAVHGSADRFCAHCGQPLPGGAAADAEPPLLASSRPPVEADGAAGATAELADTLADEA